MPDATPAGPRAPSPHATPCDSARRRLLAAAGTALAAAALPVATAFARPPGERPQQPAALPADALLRPLPGGGTVPAVGLGTFLTFDVLPGQPRAHLQEVLRTYWNGGARVVDTSPLYGSGETTVGDAATALGIGDRLFVANKIWSTGEFLADDSHALRSLEQSRSRLWRERIDLMQCHSLVNADVVVPLLRAWKREGRVGLVGISHHETAQHPTLLDWVRRGLADAVQVNYSIASDGAERDILPAAAERGMAVLVNMPFEKARLFALVGDRPLPPFARELGIDNWAAYFLKWVVSHPAVTCVLPSTSDPAHAAENIAALRGPLPDAAMRRRMRDHVAGLPGFADLAKQPWYPGKRYPGQIARAQAALRERG